VSESHIASSPNIRSADRRSRPTNKRRSRGGPQTTVVLSLAAVAVTERAGAEGAPSPGTQLAIALWSEGASGPTMSRWRLRCDPHGGTLPRAAAACGRPASPRAQAGSLRSPGGPVLGRRVRGGPRCFESGAPTGAVAWRGPSVSSTPPRAPSGGALWGLSGIPSPWCPGGPPPSAPLHAVSTTALSSTVAARVRPWPPETHGGARCVRSASKVTSR
jgi:hypothetical protein